MRYSPSRALLVQDAVTALLATNRLALIDANLDTALGAQVVHGRRRGGLARLRGRAALGGVVGLRHDGGFERVVGSCGLTWFGGRRVVKWTCDSAGEVEMLRVWRRRDVWRLGAAQRVTRGWIDGLID